MLTSFLSTARPLRGHAHDRTQRYAGPPRRRLPKSPLASAAHCALLPILVKHVNGLPSTDPWRETA